MLVLIILFGAKDAPKILRKLNEMISRLRSTADHFKYEVLYGDLTADEQDVSGDAGLAVYTEEEESGTDVEDTEAGSPEPDEPGDDDAKSI